MSDQVKQQKTWREKRERKEIRTSASQHETFELCPRKWWLLKVRRMPTKGATHSQAFGTVLHNVCERYLEADDLGRDPNTGKAVELFPDGWHIAHNRYGGIDGELSVTEQVQVKNMIDKAIEDGVLERRPDREVEKYFRESVIKMDDGTNIQIEGYIDVAYPDLVEDHKTSKNSRYLKTAKTLAKNTQVLIYAKITLEEIRRKGGAIPRHITVRHNQYVKDPKEKRPVRVVEAQIPIEDIDAFWNNRIIENMKSMYRVRTNADKWSDIKEPPDLAKACNAFGGCDFIPICCGRETEEQFEARLDPEKSLTYNASLTVEGKKPDKGAVMDLKARMAAARAAGSASETPAETSINPPIGEGDAQAPVSKATQTLNANSNVKSGVLGTLEDGTELVLPPWVDPDNLASQNDGLGFREDGSPCQITNARAKKANRPTADLFDIEAMGDGTVFWVGKQGTEADGMQGYSPLTMSVVPSGEAEAPTEETPAETPAEPETKPEPKQEAPKEEPKQEAPKEETAKEEAPKKKGGRPSKGFVLVINGSAQGTTGQKGSGRHVHNLHKIMDEVGEIIAKELGKSSFFEVDAFKRRDCLAHYASSLVEGFKTDFVVCQGIGNGASDMKTLVDALIPHAGLVINATPS